MKKRIRTALLGVLVFAALITSARAQVVRLEIDRREAFAEGHVFGRTGAYEKITGRLHIEVDPLNPANQRVTDLRLAPRNSQGNVEFWTDFVLLKPVEPARGNQRLLYDVNNRGNKIALGSFNDQGGNNPLTLADTGNGFLMREGYSILWCGWSGDVESGMDRLQIDLPIARQNGKTITGKIYTEIEISVTQLYLANVINRGRPASSRLFSHPFIWGMSRAYPAVSLDNRNATLTKRQQRSEPAIKIPRHEWSFARYENGEVISDPTHVYIKEGFRPGWLYELVYEGKNPRVTGLGFVAVRDAVSFFRYKAEDRDGNPNPLAGIIEYAYGYGASQSGRFLNHFIYENFNGDVKKRLVFDGVLAHVAGAGKGIFNYRFAQTTRHGSHHEENLYPSDFFPFTSVDQVDPVTGQRGNTLARAREAGHVPKVFLVQTSTEYWCRGSSLVHTDVEGTRDVGLDPNVRLYLLSGTPHNSMTGGKYQNPLNRLNTRPLLRALLVALDSWVSTYEEPPESRYPSIADHTLVELDSYRKSFPKIPGVQTPESFYAPLRLDPGPHWQSEGIADFVPPKVGQPYHTLVPAVDEDGNEVAGIRLPDIAVPLATYTGWNLRADEWGAGGMLTRWMGSQLPFPRTPGERKKNGDPRLSILERYPKRETYIAKVAEAALDLQRQRFLLEEDVVKILAAAAERRYWEKSPSQILLESSHR